MPELPEVETVVRSLQGALPGRRILEVRLGKTDFIEDPAALEEKLPGSRIARVRRHGKFIVFELESKNGSAEARTLLIHLGMTGQIRACAPEEPVAAHTHVFLSLDDGREMRYVDIRRFGEIRLRENGAQAGALEHLGPDPTAVSEEKFTEQIRSRQARVKALLLDQRVLSGIGNIYADESLWRARIHPRRVGANLSKEEHRRLYRAVRDVLSEAIRLRGSSISDYVDADGNRGEFQMRHRVYQREGKKCFRCKALIRREIVAGRSSHFCPRCQRPPRMKAGARKRRVGRVRR
jgi:formamidopyrimidine-DNA glycosylase